MNCTLIAGLTVLVVLLIVVVASRLIISRIDREKKDLRVSYDAEILYKQSLLNLAHNKDRRTFSFRTSPPIPTPTPEK